ncbi:hypothetical protein RZS08_58065, partial [Arthrospira platensis SPKY1]|nr:hypothetical protein [Arthrospira platensis SPKY1]
MKMNQLQQLSSRIQVIEKRGRIYTNQDLYAWIKWHYGKGRPFTDTVVLPQLKWKEFKSPTYPYQVLGKFLSISDLKDRLRL